MTADKLSGPAPLTVCFDGSQSYDLEGGVLIYEWDFNDGTNGNTDAVCHTYVNPGTYTVTFGVGDVRGVWDFEHLEIGAQAPAVPALPRAGRWLLGIILSLAGAYGMWSRARIPP